MNSPPRQALGHVKLEPGALDGKIAIRSVLQRCLSVRVVPY